MLSDFFKDKMKYKLRINRVMIETEILPQIEAQESLIKDLITQFEKYKEEYFCSHKRQVCQNTCRLNFDKNDCLCLNSDKTIQQAKEKIK
jgi:hypothetical protein